jgi:SAM-dependent methyltransferase
MKHHCRNLIYILTLLTLIVSCNQNQEKPGGYQNLDRPQTPKNPNGFDDLVADYESKDRLIWQKPEMVIRLLGDLSTKTVGDLGAGTGFFAFRMVPKAKKVVAIDIDQRFITFMDSAKNELPLEYRSRFETRLVEPNNPKLKNGELDAVIIVNTYMYIGNRVDYMKLLRKGMSKGGKVLIVEYKEKNIPVGPPVSIKVALSTVERELKEAGFRGIVADDTSLDYQYIITAINEG